MKKNEVVMLAEHGCTWVQGHACDKGKHFEFFDVFLGGNTCVSMDAEEFAELVGVFREIIGNEDKVHLN